MSRKLLSVFSPLSKQVNNLYIQTPRLTFIRNDENTLDIFPTPKRWLLRNQMMHEPQSPEDPRRRAVYYHVRPNVKYSPKKMWYICPLVRGLTVDEAIKQLKFVPRKGAHLLLETIVEAQQKAVDEGIIEFKSNMWVGECFAGRGIVMKGYRKHARHMPGEVRCYHIHLFVALVEGPPPEHFYSPAPMSNKQKLDAYIDRLRLRRVEDSI